MVESVECLPTSGRTRVQIPGTYAKNFGVKEYVHDPIVWEMVTGTPHFFMLPAQPTFLKADRKVNLIKSFVGLHAAVG